MIIPILPEAAPFTTAQRAWLNGFFAGLLGASTQPSFAPLSSSRVQQSPGATSPQSAEEEFPWHDPSLPLEDRLRLAEGKPVARVLMAAMAQLDCGACGYLCKTYSEAIARGEEKNLTLCAPGGAATAKKLKELLAWRAASPAEPVEKADGRSPAMAQPHHPEKNVHDRRNPFAARFVKSLRLNGPGSEKDTRLVVLDLEGSGISYEVGDSLGICPENCPDLVEAILQAYRWTGRESVAGPQGQPLRLREALASHFTITRPTEALLTLLLEGRAPPAGVEELMAEREVIDFVEDLPSASMDPARFIATLSPLQPRLYSISSSPRRHPDEVHLTVGVVRYSANGRGRKGVASTYLADRVMPGQRVRIFVQPSPGFRLPRNDATPMIMVGPGTGIAPFRAFLEERKAVGAKGASWLFFGDQRREHDFLYRDELEDFQRQGLLARLDTAFSRDQTEKVYVQHRMLESSAEIWAWLEAGAHFYVCGDAKLMARDVDEALRRIIRERGGLPEAEAKANVDALKREKRYQRDVY